MLSIKVPVLPFQKLVFPLLSPEMTVISLVTLTHHTMVSLFRSLRPVTILAVGCPVSMFHSLTVSVLPVAMWTLSGCQEAHSIRPSCLSSTFSYSSPSSEMENRQTKPSSVPTASLVQLLSTARHQAGPLVTGYLLASVLLSRSYSTTWP